MISALKALRRSQPFNWLATSAARLLCGPRPPEGLVLHLHRLGGVTSRLPNGEKLRLWSRADDWVSNQVFWRGWRGYEPETAPLWYEFARRAGVVVDVGAYVGFYTLLAAHANPEARVWAFEALPAVYRRLERNVALNRLMRVTCVASAVGAEEGQAEFYHVARGLPTSSSLSASFMDGAAGLTHTTVPVVSLDRFLARSGVRRVDLMKLDTESTEPEVLAGAWEILRRDHPHLFCEVLRDRGSESALQAALAPLGYRFYLLTPEGPVEQPEVRGHPEWLNYLFTRLGPEELPR